MTSKVNAVYLLSGNWWDTGVTKGQIKGVKAHIRHFKAPHIYFRGFYSPHLHYHPTPIYLWAGVNLVRSTHRPGWGGAVRVPGGGGGESSDPRSGGPRPLKPTRFCWRLRTGDRGIVTEACIVARHHAALLSSAPETPRSPQRQSPQRELGWGGMGSGESCWFPTPTEGTGFAGRRPRPSASSPGLQSPGLGRRDSQGQREALFL